MKHLRKRFLALLALTLFGGAGAWAQGPTQVTQITTDMIASWEGVNEYITLADLQALGFEATDYATAAAWTGAPQSGSCYLLYAISGSNTAYVYFTAGSENDNGNGALLKADIYYDVDGGWKYFITGSPSPEPAAIELTKSGANQWTLASMPDYDVELQMEYYDQYTLDSIPLDWQVKVGDAAPVHPTAYTEGNTSLGHLTIYETDSVELIPPADVKRTVKSVTLVDASAPAGLRIDLATVTTDTTVGDGDTLTGMLGANVQISIADGATVTLDGVTINGVYNTSYNWAGITCLGDATIILSGTNTVKGFYDEYPGIYVPQDKTVTIEGSGSLTASSNGYGCGIGGGYQIACGNIVIADGTITATGGDQAGIGGGYQSSCGTISITGGTVTATGGNSAAGIGSGQSGSCGNISITGGTINATGGHKGAGIGCGEGGSCGNITITNGVTSVTATKGNLANHSIGRGYGTNSSCGTVTVMGVEGTITDSPYTYPQN